MLCEKCHQKKAMVHLAQSFPDSADPTKERHFCESCADAYFRDTPELSSCRNLICLSDSYRSKLYDLLEAAHPEAFKDDDESIIKSATIMSDFLRQHLENDKIEVNEVGFSMLLVDFMCSHHFYTRRDKHNGRE